MVQDHSQVPMQVKIHYELLKQADWYAYKCRNAQNGERPQETIPMRIRLDDRQAHLRDLPKRLKVLNAVPYMGAKDVYGHTNTREQRNDFAQPVDVPIKKLMAWARAVREWVSANDRRALQMRRLDILRGDL